MCCAVLGIWLFVTPWTVAHQAPLSMGILQTRILEWVACPPPGDLPNPGMEPRFSEPRSPTLQANSLLSEPTGKPKNTGVDSLSLLQPIFMTQELNWSLLHCRQILQQLSYQGNPSVCVYTCIRLCMSICMCVYVCKCVCVLCIVYKCVYMFHEQLFWARASILANSALTVYFPQPGWLTASREISCPILCQPPAPVWSSGILYSPQITSQPVLMTKFLSSQKGEAVTLEGGQGSFL